MFKLGIKLNGDLLVRARTGKEAKEKKAVNYFQILKTLNLNFVLFIRTQ